MKLRLLCLAILVFKGVYGFWCLMALGFGLHIGIIRQAGDSAKYE